MNLERGQRQTQRTKTALISAFTALLREKGYQATSIQDIVVRANTGRSTFYRYFQSKPDVILEMHKDIFARAKIGPTSAAAWLADDPPPQLVQLLENFRQTERSPIYAATELGADADYVIRQLDLLISRQFEESLHHSFAEQASAIPFAILAQSIAGVYSWLSRSAMLGDSAFTAMQLAEYIHRLSRAMLREALG
ncbi:MAG: TetR/AcrR family transcriptional regulator [Chloroflexi bacterium]|nr:TetR/AcrR family transcriptional regulator [Chloroflexota bacterium]